MKRDISIEEAIEYGTKRGLIKFPLFTSPKTTQWRIDRLKKEHKYDKARLKPAAK